MYTRAVSRVPYTLLIVCMAGMGKCLFSSVDNHYPTKPSPAAEVESRRCNLMMQNPASKICVQVITTTRQSPPENGAIASIKRRESPPAQDWCYCTKLNSPQLPPGKPWPFNRVCLPGYNLVTTAKGFAHSLLT
jgi:hypothetical protein